MKVSYAVPCLIALMSLCSFAQEASEPKTDTLSIQAQTQPQTSKPTVSYLYVGGPDAIHAYDIAADGTMTAMKGAPFAGILNTFIPPIVNGTYMFAWDGDISSYDNLLYLYKIEAGGVLKKVNTIDFSNYYLHGEENMFLDKKGETLYVTDESFGPQLIYAFQVNWSKATLTDLGGVPGLPGPPGTTGYFYYPPKFLANDKYLYTGTGGSSEIYGWTRTSNGSLAAGPSTSVGPVAPDGYVAIAGTVAAADSANHLVLPYTFHEGDSSGAQWGPEQLAIFSADALGNLITTDTYLTMPADEVGGYHFNIQFSPSGKLIAISGPAGLQFFHFDGVHITPYTGLVSTASFAYFRWDNSNHLYAFDSNTGKLHIFNATPTSVTEAPGSPHTMPFPVSFDYAGFTVQSLN